MLFHVNGESNRSDKRNEIELEQPIYGLDIIWLVNVNRSAFFYVDWLVSATFFYIYFIGDKVQQVILKHENAKLTTIELFHRLEWGSFLTKIDTI